jgi:hypothetical protein
MGNLTLSGATSGQITIAPPAVAGTNTLTLPASTGSILTNPLVAGTASVAPLSFTSGTNLTSATAGAFEYDGTSFYGTPIGAQRGIVPGMQYFRLNSSLAGANSTATQSIFGVGVTLSSNTVYEFEAMYAWTKTAGTTSHTVSFLFGGTATINNIYYTINTGGDSVSGQNGYFLDTSSIMFGSPVATAKSIGSFSTLVQNRGFSFRGTVSVNAGGTFIPQYVLSAAPGGAYTVLAGSFFLIYPIGAAGANTSVGTWA